MDSIVINAPAKVNLFLRVVGKRPDGYHTIETLFEKIALFDRITLRKIRQDTIEVSTSGAPLPDGAGNIAYRAAVLLKARCDMPGGMRIEIAKAIPVASGLGGGSSDAAAVLLGAKTLFGLNIPRGELLAMAGELGADVPFFMTEKSWAIGRARGDETEPVKSDLRLWHILAVPSFPVLSREAYEWSDTAPDRGRGGISDIIAALRRGDVGAIGENMHNDLEGLSLNKDKRLRELKDTLLKDGAAGALISGSGPALFGIFSGKGEVTALRKRLEEKIAAGKYGYRILVAPTLY